MNIKKALTFAIFAFLGVFAVLKLVSLHKTYTPFTTFLSDKAYVHVEPKKPFGIINFSIMSELGAFHSSFFGSDDTKYLQNACVNGQDTSSMGVQEQLLQFIQGPCLPVVLVPGLLASKLQVNIDCETLQSQNPDIFSSCGWSTCSGWNILRNTPASEYTLWVSSVTSPMNLIFGSSADCWGNLIQLEYDPSAPDIAQKYSSPAGVEVIIQSQTDDQQEECGLSAEDNLLISPVQVGYTVGYEAMKNALINMGYQVGLTLYGAPYDWRKTTLANGIVSNLNATVRQIHSLTGKPTIIVAHSLGNFGTLYLLNNMPQEEKDTYIANYVSVMNPLSGSPSSIGDYVGGDTDYVFHSFGVNFAAQKKLLQGNSGSVDVLPKDPFTQFAGSQWLQDFLSRMQLENTINVDSPDGQAEWEDIVSSRNYTYQWFPTPLQQCFQGFTNRSDHCGLFMYDWSAEPMLTIQDQVYTGNLDDIAEIFENYVTVTDNYEEMNEDCKANNIYLLQNPGVPTTIVYGSHLLTKKAYVFDYNPNDITNTNNFALPNITTYTQGDETVPTTSSLLTALKWSWEFDNNVSNAKPVKTVEVCSIYNSRDTIYDLTDSDAPYQVLSNEYQGVGCDCIPENGTTTTGGDCSHSDIVADSVLVKFIQNIAYANAPNANYNQTIAYLLNDTQLTNLANNCPTVAIGTTVYGDLVDEVTAGALFIA